MNLFRYNPGTGSGTDHWIEDPKMELHEARWMSAVATLPDGRIFVRFVVDSVTRWGEFSPLWKKVLVFWQFVLGFILN